MYRSKILYFSGIKCLCYFALGVTIASITVAEKNGPKFFLEAWGIFVTSWGGGAGGLVGKTKLMVLNALTRYGILST